MSFSISDQLILYCFFYCSATTNMACGTTCVNTTISNASRVAFYSFDNVTTDATGTYPLNGLATYVSGWVDSAVSFLYSNSQLLATSVNIPLNSRSFTIDFWFYTTNLSGHWDFAFAGEKDSSSTRKCLFLNIRNNVTFFGFFNDDTTGTIFILPNKWYHIAFVYDNSSGTQYIYLNGQLDTSSSASTFSGNTGVFTIGGASIGGSTATTVYYSGYIDHFTISTRVKSACEIYLAANLACYFTFDTNSLLDDSGPNFLTAFNNGATSVAGRVNQAFRFSSTLSYITTDRISALLSSNTAFSISMWINPTNVTGGATLIHTSTQANGKYYSY